MDYFQFQHDEEQAALYEEELAQFQIQKNKVNQINSLLQDVSFFLGPNRSQYEKELRINIPYGYLRTANQFRELLSFLSEDHVRANIAYQLILSDFFTWLIQRTTIQGTLQEMIIKNEVLCKSKWVNLFKRIKLIDADSGRFVCQGTDGRRTMVC